MPERFATVGDLELCYDTVGDPTDPTLLLIMGLGLGLDWWREDLCRDLAARGLHVVRFDQRDVGRSTHLSGPGITPWQFVTRRARPVYTLADMADDAAGLARALDPRGAHVVGVSLGAMVAQEVAVRHPSSTRSLTSIMGRPGDGRTGRVSWRRVPDFLRPPPADPVEGMVASFRRIGSTFRTADDDADVRATMRASLAREAGVGDGAGRQLAACVAERDRTADLRGLDLPALVVHGTDDLVIRPDGGRATAAALRGCELVEIPGMGHDLARAMWPTLVDHIAATVIRTRG